MALKIISFLLCLFCLLQATSQTYEVIHHRGDIQNLQTKQALKKGSRFKASDPLRIRSANHCLAVLDEHQSAFIMRPKTKSGQLIPYYHPIPHQFSGRDGLITNSIVLIRHFNEDTAYLIAGDKCRVTISPTFFKMNQDSFFYIRYYWLQDTINKRLDFEGNELFISKEALFQAQFYSDERYQKDTIIQIPPAEVVGFELRCAGATSRRIFFDPSQPDHLQQRDFIPIQLKFLEDEVLIDEVSFFQTAFPKETLENWLERFHAYLQERFAGKLEADNLKTWLEIRGK